MDFDYLVIGSGFGGSVSALRLAEKGYKVAVIESGKRWRAQDFPKTNWALSKFLWMPKLFCYGIQRINLLNDVLVLSGAGVGGGSLVYANTLYVPPQKFFDHPVLTEMGGLTQLLPFYETAKHMLGVVENPKLWEVDRLMKQTAAEFGVEHTFTPTPVAICFDDHGGTDPYFGGKGPARNACTFCGGCMVGCRYNAKNTLDKNYLYFAEKLGVQVMPERKVTRITPLNADGSGGYAVESCSTTGWFGSPKRTFTTKGIVVSAGVLGTLSLLLKMKDQGVLPNLSDRLGETVRTNSESVLGVTSLDPATDYSKGIAITSSIHLNENTHVEPVRYSKHSDAMGLLAVPFLIDGNSKIPRQLIFLWHILKSPLHFLKFLSPFGFAQRSIILLVMQTLDNSIRVKRRVRWLWPFAKTLSSQREQGKEIPVFIPIANAFAKKLAEKMGGVARSSLNEVACNVPLTAHILGGACIGKTPANGVIDLQNRVFGYKNFYICDGSMIPANLGVNPSLTIAALTERAMSLVPDSKQHN